jgi:DNA-binding NtrC family response regulator
MPVKAVNQVLAEIAGDPPESLSVAGGAILIIEDCEPLLFYLNSALLALGYKNQFLAANLAEAHAAWAQHKSEISHVILNYELPDGLCFEFASILVRERPDVKIVMTSGYDIASIREDTRATDRFQFLQKPFRLSELKDALEVESPARAFCT